MNAKKLFLLAAAVVAPGLPGLAATNFVGRITAVQTRGGDGQTIFFTAGTNVLRVECADTNRPFAKNLVARDSGAVTILFPHNRSFMRLKNSSGTGVPPVSPEAAVGLSANSNPQLTGGTPVPLPAGIGPTNLPGVPSPPMMPAMPAGMPVPTMMPPNLGGGMPPMPRMPMMGEVMELKATGEKTNLLGYACEHFQITQRGETMEIWATDKLFPFHAWRPNQPPRFGPQLIEEKWGDLVRAKHLFPLRATLTFDHGPERLRFEVTRIAPGEIADPDGTLFLPPADYQELEPLPF